MDPVDRSRNGRCGGLPKRPGTDAERHAVLTAIDLDAVTQRTPTVSWKGGEVRRQIARTGLMQNDLRMR